MICIANENLVIPIPGSILLQDSSVWSKSHALDATGMWASSLFTSQLLRVTIISCSLVHRERIFVQLLYKLFHSVLDQIISR